LVVDLLDFLTYFFVDLFGVSFPAFALIEFGPYVVEVLIDVFADDEESVSVVGLGL